MMCVVLRMCLVLVSASWVLGDPIGVSAGNLRQSVGAEASAVNAVGAFSNAGVFPFPVAGATEKATWKMEGKMSGDERRGNGGWKAWARDFEQTAYRTLSSSMSQIMSIYIVILSLLTLIPFAWFTFAGQTPYLHKYYLSLTSSFGIQAMILSLLDTLNIPDGLIVLGCCCALASKSWWCYTNPDCPYSQMAIDIWFGVVLITLFLVLASPFIVLNNQYVFWILVILLAYVLTFAYPMLPYEQTHITGFKIALCSGYGLTSAICVLASLFGINGSFDFVTYFSVPSTFSYSNANSMYILILVTASVFGTYVNGIRDKKLQV